jgi:hypothetical protein
MNAEDDWDKIVLLEKHSYNKGIKIANKEVLVSENAQIVREEGYKAGFFKGCVIGFELGFYSIVTANTESLYPAVVPSRPKSLLLELRQRVEAFPRNNQTEIDFDSEVQSLRSLYKGSGSRLGKFPPSSSDNSRTQEQGFSDW